MVQSYMQLHYAPSKTKCNQKPMQTNTTCEQNQFNTKSILNKKSNVMSQKSTKI